MFDQAIAPGRNPVFPEEMSPQGRTITFTPPPPRETGFGENFGADFHEMLIAGNATTGADYGLRTEYDRIIQELAVHGETARVSAGTLRNAPAAYENPLSAPYGGADGRLSREETYGQIWAAIARVRQRDPNFLSDVGTDRADLERRVHQRNEAELGRIREVQAGATGWGRIGGFLGGMTGNLLDPGNLAALPMGGASRTLLGGVAKNALSNMLVETAEQPIVMGRYRALGEEHTVGDALTSIGAAGVFGGALHAGHRGGQALYDRVLPQIFESLPAPLQRRWADAMRLGDGPDAPLLIDTLPHVLPREAWDPDTRAAVHVLQREEDVRGATPFTPTPAGDEAHGRAMADALRALESGEPYVPAAGGAERGTVTRGTSAPRRFASRQAAIVDLGQQLVDQGLIVGENRHVGNRRFTPGAHQTGEAHGDHMIDVNDSHMPPGSPQIEARNPEVRARFDALARDAQRRGYRILWNEHIWEPYGDGPGRRIPGADSDGRQHRNHIHFEAPEGLVGGNAGGAQAGRTPGAHYGDRSLSVGIRNNNPGNLGDGELARSMPGYRGNDGRFARFATMEEGIAAQEELLRRRVASGRSIATLIRGTGHNDGYAPSERTGGDNPEAAVASYIAELSRRLGKEPNARLTEADIPHLAEAMRDREAPHWRDYLGEGAPAGARAGAGDGGAAEIEALRAETALREAQGGVPGETPRPFDLAGEAESAFDRPPVLSRELFDSDDSWAAAQRQIDLGWRIQNDLEYRLENRRLEPENGAPQRETGGEALGQPRALATLSGAEMGVLAPETVVRSAQEWYRANLQGSTVFREGLGEVRFTAKGMKKTRGGLPFDLDRARLLPAVRDIIAHGDYQGRFPVDASRRDGIVAFHHIFGDVELNGAHLRAGVSIGEDARGKLYYNVNRDPEALLARRDDGAVGSGVTKGKASGPEPGAAIAEGGDDLNLVTAPTEFGRRSRGGLRSETALSATLDAPSLRTFDLPDGDGARLQAESLGHDMRAAITADPAKAEQLFYAAEGSPEKRPLAAILDELDGDVAAAAAIKGCLQ